MEETRHHVFKELTNRANIHDEEILKQHTEILKLQSENNTLKRKLFEETDLQARKIIDLKKSNDKLAQENCLSQNCFAQIRDDDEKELHKLRKTNIHLTNNLKSVELLKNSQIKKLNEYIDKLEKNLKLLAGW